jgi:branched-chain amino acid transport system substrate-binding protein
MSSRFGRFLVSALFAVACLELPQPLHAQPTKPELRIGAVLAASGGAASIGTPERNAVALLQERYAAADLPFTVKVVLYDDASDPTKSTSAVRRLVQEDKVHIVICCTTTPSSAAVLETLTASGTPGITLAAAASVVEPASSHYEIFKTSATDRLMIARMLEEVSALKAKRIAVLFADDSYGDSGLTALQSLLPAQPAQLVATERVARNDTNFTPQALRVRQANPDVVYIHTYTPACDLAQEALRRVGYTGPIIQSQGAASTAFLSLGGKSIEGTIVTVAPVLLHDQLPANDPMKAMLDEFVRLYDAKFGAGKADTYSAMGWDPVNLAVKVFGDMVRKDMDVSDLEATRRELRDGIEATKDYVGVSGVFNFSPDDHVGLLPKGAVLLSTVKDGRFVLLSN